MSEQEFLETEENLIEQLKERFVAPENFRRNSEFENRRILNEKASLLIYLSIFNKEINSFMGESYPDKDGLITYKLKNPINIKRQCDIPGWEFKNNYLFDKIYFNPSEQAINKFRSSNKFRLSYGNNEKYGLYLCEENPFYHWINDRDSLVYNDKTSFTNEKLFYSAIDEAIKISKQKTLFEHCQEITPYKTPEEVIRYFSHNPKNCFPYVLLNYSSAITCRYFIEDSDTEPKSFTAYKGQFSNYDEVDLAQGFLFETLLSGNKDISITQFFEKLYRERYKQVFSFQNEYGEIVQKAVKVLDFENRQKFFLPVTSWTRNKCSGNHQFKIPGPEKQILFNFNILQRENLEAIILTNSLDIAAINQNKHYKTRVAWISWLPGRVEDFDDIDWEPLKNRVEPIYYLVTNHSGNKLEEEYLKSKPVIDYLKDKLKTEIKIIQVEMDHSASEKARVHSISELLELCPKHFPDSIEILTYEKFEANCKKAEEELDKSKLPLYLRLHSQESLPDTIEEDEIISGKKPAVDYVIRPIIKAKCLHILHAARGCGKSKLAIGLCASVVAGEKVFDHKHWVVPRLIGEIQRKILYFDFEYQKNSNDIQGILEAFAYSKFPKAADKIKICKDNFIYEDCSKLNADLTIASNRQQILDIINKAKDKGNKGRIPDLIVFDTYSKIVGGNDEKNDWSLLMPLFNEITSLGSAILIITHPSSSDINRSRGYLHKEDDVSVCIKISKENIASPLSEPLTIAFTKNDTSSIKLDTEEFKVLYDKDVKWWRAEGASRATELEEFADISREYIKDGYLKEAIYQMMDLPKQSFYDVAYDTAYYLSTEKKMSIDKIAEKMGVNIMKTRTNIEKGKNREKNRTAKKTS